MSAVASLPVRSCLIDGDESGLAVFELIRQHGAGGQAVLCAFDLLELNGKDLRFKPIEPRKELLAKLLDDADVGIVFNISRGLQARLRGHCLETAWLNLSSWPFTALGQGQE